MNDFKEIEILKFKNLFENLSFFFKRMKHQNFLKKTYLKLDFKTFGREDCVCLFRPLKKQICLT